MSSTDKNNCSRGRAWRGLSAGLAGLGWLAACLGASAQVSVDTIGGGVRTECGPAYGFTNGSTFESAQFNGPWACALDTNGNLWIADRTNRALEQVTLAGNKGASVTIPYAITNIVVKGTTTNYTTNYQEYTNISGVAVDPANNLYVLLAPSNQVEVVKYALSAESLSLNPLSVLVLTGAPSNSAAALAVDAQSNVFVAFTNGVLALYQMLDTNHSPTNIYTQNYMGGEVRQFVVNSGFNWRPSGLALRADGSLAVADTLSNAIYVIPTNYFIAGGYATNLPQLLTGGNGAGYVEGSASAAQFNQPRGLAATSDGDLIVCDMLNDRLRVVDTNGNTSWLYGTGSNVWQTNCCSCNPALYAGWVDGVAGVTSTNASSRLPVSVAIAPSGTLFVTEIYYSLIRQVTNTTFAPVNLSASFPVGATVAASGVTATNATLNGTVFPGDSPTYYYFEWGTNSNYGNFTATNLLAAGLTTTQNISANLGFLLPNTTYYYQLVVFNGLGYTNGGPLTLLTSAESPVATTVQASGITSTGAILNATVNPDYSPTTVYFQYGTTTNYGTLTALTNLAASATNQSVSLAISNLQPNTIYYFQAVAASSGGTTDGSSLVFSTSSAPPFTNAIGFAQSLSDGPGAHVYIPVYVNLQTNSTLKSVQFRIEITPNPANAPMIPPFSLRPLTSNDLVQFAGPAPGNTPVTFDTFAYTTSSNGQGLVVTAQGNNSGLDMQGSGVVVLLHVAIPTNAIYGQSYSLNVLDPSGTSDGQQAGIPLIPMPMQTLSIAYTPYMVGDSSPTLSYNAGQFGNAAQGNAGLDNADVNNAIYASMGIRVPPSDSDLFNSMDAWPPDPQNGSGHGGDGFIRLLDWETILGRSLGVSIYNGMVDTNFLRFWSNGVIGYPAHSVFPNWVAGDPPVPLSLDSATSSGEPGPTKLALVSSPPGLVWFCQASIGAGTVTSALPGNTCSLPVYVNVSPGYSVAALQFRAVVTGSAGAPAVTSNWFTPAASMTAPLVLPGLSGNDTVQAWGFGSFAQPLQNSNYLGTVSFQVPPAANQGASYALHFSGVDGAPDFTTSYQLESHPGYVWVMSEALQPASITSDEWKLAFFGSLTNELAGDNVDADGDGALNWQEYLAGTNPTNAQSCLAFSSASSYNNGVRGLAINWLTAPGKTYILQSSAALNGAPWTPINTNSGDGNEYQCVVTNISGTARFYQIRLQP